MVRKASPFPSRSSQKKPGPIKPTELSPKSTDADVEACLARVALDEHVVVDEIDLDQIYLLVMPEDPEAEPIVTFVVLPRCEIVYVG